MWRSFFLAVGIGLFLLGAQALLIDHVVVPKNTKLQRLVTKILSDESSEEATPAPQLATTPPPAQTAARWNQPQPSSSQQQNRFGYDSGSRFGPSRFSGPAYGNYGGSRVSQNSGQRNGANPNQLFQRPTPNAQLASFRTGTTPPPAVKAKALQKVKIREWMPWSLLAAGSIIFFYTQSIHRRGYGE